MKKIKIHSEYQCLIYTNNNQILLEDGESLEIEDTNISIYPIETKNILPFKINFDSIDTKRYRIVEDENFIHCFLFCPIVISKKAIEKIKVAGIQLEITLSKTQLSIKSDIEQIDLPLELDLKEYVCKSIEKFLVITANNFLIVYNPKTRFFKIVKGTSFEFENNEITFCQNLSNFAKTNLKKRIILKQDEITEINLSIENESYYLQEECICFAFLDCIMNENYSLAKELLSSSFEDANEKDFINFFGKFYKFFPLSQTKFVLIYPQENKIINFKQENHKICDFGFHE